VRLEQGGAMPDRGAETRVSTRCERAESLPHACVEMLVEALDRHDMDGVPTE
jgi:hypothetical protein